jgi:hypothetical protein
MAGSKDPAVFVCASANLLKRANEVSCNIPQKNATKLSFHAINRLEMQQIL